jgi:hypothetical protein
MSLGDFRASDGFADFASRPALEGGVIRDPAKRGTDGSFLAPDDPTIGLAVANAAQPYVPRKGTISEFANA